MTEVQVSGKILEWGNSYGIRVRKEDLDRAGLTPGAEVVVRIEEQGKVDLTGFPAFKGGGKDDSIRHDEVIGEARAKGLRRGKPR